MTGVWLEPLPLPLAAEELRAGIGGHPLVAEILARRGYHDLEAAQAFLDPALYRSTPPAELPGLERAVARLKKAIQSAESILVWGDFDVDGQTAAALLTSTLTDLGARASYYIPVRERESHGVHLPRLKALLASGVSLLLTCDTGISAHDAVQYAQSQGVDVIITDHHTLPDALPEAYAVINPRLLPAGHPLEMLPGVGTAYKLAEALYLEPGLNSQSGAPGGCERLLDLVALGIVADVAVQTGDTRCLLQQGIQVLRRAQRAGLQIMMEINDLKPAGVNEEHIAYTLAPRLNALGRLADANSAVEFLTTTDPSRARILALELEGLNSKRKFLEDQVYIAALEQIERDRSLAEQPLIFLTHPSWPAGVVGIVASRLAENFHKPAILLVTPPSEAARGSARSIAGIDINAAIASQQELLLGFGGHPMAAGLSITPENIPAFRRGIERAITAQTTITAIEPGIQIDGYLTLPEIDLELADDLQRLAPFGPGNPALVLATRNLSIESTRSIGREDKHLLLQVSDVDGNTQEVIWWQAAPQKLPEGRFDLAFSLRTTTYQGQRAVNVQWISARSIAEPGEVQPTIAQIVVDDYRQETYPLPILQRLLTQPGVQVWCEAQAQEKLGGLDRFALGQSPHLIIWSTPPGSQELRAVLRRVRPQHVYLFADDPGMDEFENFTRRLAGLAKYAINARQGQASLNRLICATAQREKVVRAGLAWLCAHGVLRVAINGDEVMIQATIAHPQPNKAGIEAQLRTLLKETAAFRAFFRRVNAVSLLQ